MTDIIILFILGFGVAYTLGREIRCGLEKIKFNVINIKEGHINCDEKGFADAMAKSLKEQIDEKRQEDEQ